MATACLRLVTRLPDRPERSWPRFISCIARSTFWPALRPYRRPPLEVRLLRLVLRLDDRLRLDVRLLRPARLVRWRPVLRLRLDLRCAMEPPSVVVANAVAEHANCSPSAAALRENVGSRRRAWRTSCSR
jgi:hypothetical protein